MTAKPQKALHLTSAKSAIRPLILILCVEDNETYLRLRQRLLEQAGYTVLSANTAAEAMEMFREAPVSLVLSDHMLRGTTGTALAKEMKSIKGDVPFILHSGNAPESMKHVDGFINKDESVSSFLALVHGFVKRYCE